MTAIAVIPPVTDGKTRTIAPKPRTMPSAWETASRPQANPQSFLGTWSITEAAIDEYAMLIVAWQSVQQIAMPSTDRCRPSRPSDSAPGHQADRHDHRPVVRGHPAVGEIARQRVEDQRRDRAQTGDEPEVDGLVRGARGRLDQPRQDVLDRGEERHRRAEVRQHQPRDEWRPGPPGDRWLVGAPVPAACSVAGRTLPFIGPAPGGTGGSPSRETTAGTSPSFAWQAVPRSTLPPGPGSPCHGADRAIRASAFRNLSDSH